MLDLDKIIQKITDDTRFTAGYATEIQPNLTKDKVYVGMAEINPAYPVSSYNEQSREGLNAFGELLRPSIIVQIVTSPKELSADIQAVYDALAGWHYDDPNTRGLSGFTLIKGLLTALNNGRVHWQYEFGLTLPALGA